MKGDKEVIEYLNEALKLELGAVNQYWLHYRLVEDWGFTRLARKEREESIEEMHHADRIIERIIFLEGLPNLQDLGRLKIGETVEEIIAADLKTEYDALPLLREAIAYCETVKDYISRELIEDILESEEEHVDFLETQQELIRAMGIQNYIQLQSEPAES